MGLESGGCFVSEGGVFAVGVIVGFNVGEEFNAGIEVADEAAILERVPMKDSVQAL